MFIVRDENTGKFKYAGRCKAVVLDNVDPDSSGKIRITHPLVGDTDWIPYLQLPGQFFVPQIGDIVYTEADCGYPEFIVAWGNLQKGETQNDDLPPEFQRATPTNQGFYSPAGHLIEIDDGKGPLSTDQGIRITTIGGNKITILEDSTSSNGLITLETSGGAKVEIDGTNDKITASVAFGDTIEVSAADGIQMSTPAGGGTSISMKSGKIDVTAAQDITVESTSGSITATGSGSEVVLGASGITAADALGNTVEMSASGIKAKEVTGAELNLSSGTVALGTSAAELLNEILTVLKAFSDNAPTLVSTTTGPGVLNPTIVTALATFATKVGLIKGSI